MKIHKRHNWHLSVRRAMVLQERLRKQIVLQNSFVSIKQIRRVAGCDLALDRQTQRAFAGVVVYSFPDLVEIERKHHIQKITFPYIPGLLAFRESPALLNALKKIRQEPDVIVFDGQGIAHPRGLGIASHLGLFLDKPTIGCAKSRLWGTYREPGPKAGCFSPLWSDDCRRIGTVLRTRDNVRPVFVSPGHLIDFETSVDIISICADGLRIPKTTRVADHYVGRIKRAWMSSSSETVAREVL